MRELIKNEKIIYERVTAKIKFFSREKGFGFIKRPNKPDVFISELAFTKSGIQNLRENDIVEFDLIPVKDKGGKAANIKLISKAPKE